MDDLKPIAEEFLRRFRPEWKAIPELAGFKQLLDNVAIFIQAPQHLRSEIEASGTLNPNGVAQQLRERLSKIVVPELRRLQRLVEVRTGELKRDRLALVQPKIDTSDTVGALLRQEVRTYLRGLNDNERLVLLTGTADTVVMEAALSAPAVLSGLTPEGRAQVTSGPLLRFSSGYCSRGLINAGKR